VEKDLFNIYHPCYQRLLATVRRGGYHRLVADASGMPVDTKRLFHRQDYEDQPDVRVLQNVRQRVNSTIARSVRNQQRGVIDDPRETLVIPARRDIATSSQVRGWLRAQTATAR